MQRAPGTGTHGGLQTLQASVPCLGAMGPGWEHCPGCSSPPLVHQALCQPLGTAALVTMEGNAEL